MIVCLCQGVSDKQVRRAVEQGASCRRQVTESCGAGGVCGGCHGEINEMIREQTGMRRAARVAEVVPASMAAAASAA